MAEEVEQLLLLRQLGTTTSTASQATDDGIAASAVVGLPLFLAMNGAGVNSDVDGGVGSCVGHGVGGGVGDGEEGSIMVNSTSPTTEHTESVHNNNTTLTSPSTPTKTSPCNGLVRSDLGPAADTCDSLLALSGWAGAGARPGSGVGSGVGVVVGSGCFMATSPREVAEAGAEAGCMPLSPRERAGTRAGCMASSPIGDAQTDDESCESSVSPSSSISQQHQHQHQHHLVIQDIISLLSKQGMRAEDNDDAGMKLT